MKGERQLESQKRHDKIKKEYAIKNGFRFLEISYWEYKKIEDILERIFKDIDKLGDVF